MRTICLDVGDARIGIAKSDETRSFSWTEGTYNRKNPKADFEYIASKAKELNADTIVVGLPLNMDGTESLRSKVTREFADELRKYTDCKIVFYDERLSTVQAERVLDDGGVHWSKRKKVVDKIAAAIILQNFLDSPLNKKG